MQFVGASITVLNLEAAATPTPRRKCRQLRYPAELTDDMRSRDTALVLVILSPVYHFYVHVTFQALAPRAAHAWGDGYMGSWVCQPDRFKTWDDGYIGMMGM
jgi:hypothetical protein